MQNGKVEILVNDQGHRITPSYVAFTDDERLVGDAAKNQAAANPTNTVFDIKYDYPIPPQFSMTDFLLQAYDRPNIQRQRCSK